MSCKSGTSFAFPSRTLYMGQDDALGQERGEAEIEEVESWRRSGRLPFRRFPTANMGQSCSHHRMSPIAFR